MKNSLNRMAEEYKIRFENSEFCSIDEFKTEFFRKARQNRQTSTTMLKSNWIAWSFAAAAVLALACGLIFFSIPAPKQQPSPTLTLLNEARRLFEPEGVGVAVVNGELATFERDTKNQQPDSLVELKINTGQNQKPIKIRFTATSGELVKIDTAVLKGEFWVYKVDKNIYMLDSDCKVRTGHKNYISVAASLPLKKGCKQKTTNQKNTVITSKVISL